MFCIAVAMAVIFRRSRSLKGERPRVAVRRKGTRELDQTKLFFPNDDTPKLSKINLNMRVAIA